jgi:hypothetical protein
MLDCKNCFNSEGISCHSRDNVAMESNWCSADMSDMDKSYNPDTKDIPLCKRNFFAVVTVRKCEVMRLSTEIFSDFR